MKLQHPQHGFHLTSHPIEIEEMKKAGWTEVLVAAQVSEAVSLPVSSGDAPEPEAATPRRGRPRKTE